LAEMTTPAFTPQPEPAAKSDDDWEEF